ncbi:MAG: threonylcarbamoyl-AMP synthase [Chloroflexota bacterium]|nr:threonylcarbamoyl-AMP synthase [Chloroflexota bacterium]
MKTRLLKADAPGAVTEAAKALTRGEVVAFPTDTVYGVAAAFGHEDALFVAKGRPQDRPIPVLLSDASHLETSGIVTPAARALAARFWPGPLTIVVAAPRRGTVGVRVPASDLARRLIAASGGQLPVTSANLSGRPDAQTAREVLEQLDGRIALVLDGGRTPGGVPSTVVDCTGPEARILREGAIPARDIRAAIRSAA